MLNYVRGVKMKIACIGYITRYNHDSITDINFKSKESILEYDSLIIDFENSYSSYISYENYRGKDRLSDNDSVQIHEDIKRRKNEMLEFLKNGKNIIVILSKKDYCYYYTGKSEYSGTGKNARRTNIVSEVFLTDALPQYPNAIEGSGKGIEVVNKKTSSFFSKYEGCFQYKAYVEEIEDSRKILNIKGTSKIISYFENYENGTILYIPEPTFKHLKKDDAFVKEEEFIKDLADLLDNIKNKSVNPFPQWANEYILPGEQSIIDNVNTIDSKIENLIKEKEIESQRLIELQYQKRLFTACDDELEEIVKEMLIKIGFEIIKYGGNEEDILMEYNKKSFIVEIKGLDKSAAEKNAAQTAKWIANYFAETGKKPKGILIVNGFKSKLLEDRQDIFPNQMLKYSTQQEICLLSTIQLLNIYYAIKNNPIEKKKIIDSIFKTNGVYKEFSDWKSNLSKKELISIDNIEELELVKE